jgi:hypothetical protein
MAFIDEVKKALRIRNTEYDSEITSIIEACKLDLQEAGVVTISETDELTQRAIILYAKANFGMANPDMEKYEKMYEKVKTTMSLATNYNSPAVA